MTVKQILYYCAVYKHRNITKAAEELIVTRPVVSRALSELEREIGIKLFEREIGGITPTAGGVKLFEMFDSFLKTYAMTIERLRNPGLAGQPRSLRIGLMDASSGWFYPLIYRKFHEKFPDIIVNIEGINAEEAESLIYNGTLDAAIAPMMSDNSQLLGSLYLYSTQWVLCTQEKGTRAGIADLSNYKAIEISKCAELSIAILETLPPPFYTYKDIVLSTKDSEMLRVAVSGGYAQAILPLDLCAHWEGVRNIPFMPPYEPRIYLLWNNGVPHSSAFDEFVNFVRGLDLEDLKNAWGVYLPQNGQDTTQGKFDKKEE